MTEEKETRRGYRQAQGRGRNAEGGRRGADPGSKAGGRSGAGGKSGRGSGGRNQGRRPVEGWRLQVVIAIDCVLLAAILIVCGMLAVRGYREKNRPELSKLVAPDWYTQDFLQRNPYSRPGLKRTEINDIVIHYVANPDTSAKKNWSYFNNLANQSGANTTSASSHFIIGLEGEIIQCIPLDEVAYANYPRNEDTVSIECCHPDETGEFTEATRESLIKLTAWLCEELHLNENHVIRHYDVIGKNCPKYYVEHEDAWKALLKDIKKKRKES